MLPHFPQLHEFLRPEAVRGETKFSFDLRDFDPSLVREAAIAVDSVDLCLLSRGGVEETTLEATSADSIWNAVMQNSIFYDSRAAWDKNLSAVSPLVDRARPFDLKIGFDAQELDAKVTDLLD